MALLDQLLAAFSWLRAHPTLALIVAYAISGVFNAAFKPRTPEEYAALPRWRQVACKFASATGLDTVKFTEMMVALLKLPFPGDGSGVQSRSVPPVLNIVQHFSDHDPERIARIMRDELQKVSQAPTAADKPAAPNIEDDRVL